MAKKILTAILFAMGFMLLFAAPCASAKSVKIAVPSAVTSGAAEKKIEKTTVTFISDTTKSSDDEPVMDSLFPEKSSDLGFSHFTWGAMVGSTIDLTGLDLSTFNADLFFGYKNAFIKIIGVGAGIHRSIQNGNNLLPVYVLFRSSFRKKPSLCFLDLQAGYSFNTWKSKKKENIGDVNTSLGLGINLSQSRRVKSFIVIAASHIYVNNDHRAMLELDTNNLYGVNLSFGVNF